MFTWHKTDIQLMKEMGINTIKTYHDFGCTPEALTMLDEFYKNGIMVIMTVDRANANSANAAAVVTYYKDHPAILMWLVGNEWDCNYYDREGWKGNLEICKDATESIAQLIKTIDTSRPVASSIGYTNITYMADIVSACPAVDIWGINIYIGASFRDFINEWKAEGITKPLFMSEMGADAFFTTPYGTLNGYEDQEAQASFDKRLWWELYDTLSADDPANVCLGGTFFEWNDEWWKAGNPSDHDNGGGDKDVPDHFSNEEWYGIVDIARNPRQVFYSLREVFHSYPQKDTILLKAQSNEGSGTEYSRFYKDNAICYSIGSSLQDGGRGMNVVVLDRKHGYFKAFRTFDTYDYNKDRAESTALANFLAGLDDGDIVMMSVCDSACHWDYDTLVPARVAIQNLLGSTLIGNSRETGVANRNSWAIIAIKGSPGTVLAEAFDHGDRVDVTIEADAGLDSDADGTINSADTDDDNDGISDSDEISRKMDPLDNDYDDDGVIDGSDTNNFAPHLVTPDDMTINATEVVDITIKAIDRDGNALTYEAYGLPAAATFDQATGHLYWQAVSDTGPYKIKVVVTDGSYYDYSVFIITVNSGTKWTLHMTEMDWCRRIPAYNSTGAAACGMILNYIREGAGEEPLAQYEIYEYAKDQPYGAELNADEVDKALGHFDPYDYLISNWADHYDTYPDGNPFQGYNFTIDTYSPAAMQDYMRDICHWMAFTVTKEFWWQAGELTERPNTPAAVPLFGSYSRWAVIQGCVTSQNPCPQPLTAPWNTPDFTVEGFWLKDPLEDGIGQDSYKTADTCQATYFKPLVTGDAYNGLLVQVAEPPAELSNAIVDIPQPEADTANLKFINSEPVKANAPSQLKVAATSASLKASPFNTKQSWRDIVDPNLLTDPEAVAAFDGAQMDKPILVTRTDEAGCDYYLVPFGEKSSARAFLVSGVIILDAKEGYFKEASWTRSHERLIKVDKSEAIKLIRQRLLADMRRELRDLKPPHKRQASQYYIAYSRILRKYNKLLSSLARAKPQLAWAPAGYSSSPYKPYWKIDFGGGSWYVTQDRQANPFQ